MSKDELPYAEVLDDFENANAIYILTYNISQKQEKLISMLKKCGNAEICIVTNIPARWDQYFGDAYAERAWKNISLYKSKLDLEHSSLSVYFNFSNHAKIIMTDNIVYVGSANYSEESADNFEAGFISTDSSFIEFLRDDIFPWIIGSAVELKTDNELILINAGLANAIVAFQSLYEEIHDSFYTYSGHSTTRDNLYYRGNAVEFSAKDVKTINDHMERYSELLGQANKIFSTQIFFDKGIENLDLIIGRFEEINEMIKGLFENSLNELASFSEEKIQEEKIQNEYLDEHYAEAYDENLDYYAQKASDHAAELGESLANACRDEADELLELLGEVKDITKEVLLRYRRLPLSLIRIDNTGR